MSEPTWAVTELDDADRAELAAEGQPACQGLSRARDGWGDGEPAP